MDLSLRRRKWQPTPVFVPGESQGRWSLVGCRLWGLTESDTTDTDGHDLAAAAAEWIYQGQFISKHQQLPNGTNLNGMLFQKNMLPTKS